RTPSPQGPETPSGPARPPGRWEAIPSDTAGSSEPPAPTDQGPPPEAQPAPPPRRRALPHPFSRLVVRGMEAYRMPTAGELVGRRPRGELESPFLDDGNSCWRRYPHGGGQENGAPDDGLNG